MLLRDVDKGQLPAEVASLLDVKQPACEGYYPRISKIIPMITVIDWVIMIGAMASIYKGYVNGNTDTLIYFYILGIGSIAVNIALAIRTYLNNRKGGDPYRRGDHITDSGLLHYDGKNCDFLAREKIQGFERVSKQISGREYLFYEIVYEDDDGQLKNYDKFRFQTEENRVLGHKKLLNNWRDTGHFSRNEYAVSVDSTYAE